MKIRLLALLLLVISLPAFAAPLTNADVVKLVKASIDEETILAKISTSDAAFDTSADALIALKAEGVSDRLMRAMVLKVPAPTQVSVARPVAPAPKAGVKTRRFDVAIHSSKYAKCDTGELRLDAKGVHATRCKGADFDLAWESVTSVCHDYGFRGTVVFDDAKGEAGRISVATPAEATEIVKAIETNRPTLNIGSCL